MTMSQGNSRSYTVSRLKREFPELYQRVVAGELSANAAGSPSKHDNVMIGRQGNSRRFNGATGDMEKAGNRNFVAATGARLRRGRRGLGRGRGRRPREHPPDRGGEGRVEWREVAAIFLYPV